MLLNFRGPGLEFDFAFSICGTASTALLEVNYVGIDIFNTPQDTSVGQRSDEFLGNSTSVFFRKWRCGSLLRI